MANFKTKLPTVEEMLEAGVHFGHQARRKNPHMDKYIYSTDEKNHVIDIFQTQELLENACESLYEIAKSGRQIIFVGTKRQASKLVKERAMDAGAMYVVQRWLGGTLTNYDSVKGNWEELERLEIGMKENKFGHYTKKERLLIDRKIEKLETFVGGIRNMDRHPGAMIVVDIKREKTAVSEANALGIPVFAIVDTNSDPTPIDYVIPGNDDAIKSIDLLISAFASVVKEGYANPDKELVAKAKAASDAVDQAIADEKKRGERPQRRGRPGQKKNFGGRGPAGAATSRPGPSGRVPGSSAKANTGVKSASAKAETTTITDAKPVAVAPADGKAEVKTAEVTATKVVKPETKKSEDKKSDKSEKSDSPKAKTEEKAEKAPAKKKEPKAKKDTKDSK